MESVIVECFGVIGMVGEEAQSADPEVAQDHRGRFEAGAADRVVIAEAERCRGSPEVDDDAAAGDAVERGVELLAALALDRGKILGRETAGVNAHEGRLGREAFGADDRNRTGITWIVVYAESEHAEGCRQPRLAV